MIGFIISPFITIAGLFAWIPVSIFAIRGKYPKWLLTPDDTVSPFGQYEPTVKKIYDKFGRYAGDLYWLGFRNTLYGLSYAFKPKHLKSLTTYKKLEYTIRVHGCLQIIKVGKLYEITVRGLGLALIWGNRLSPIVTNDGNIRHPNMDGRPVFSVRLKNNA